MLGTLTFFTFLPIFCWFWKPEIKNLCADIIAEGIKRSQK